MIPSPKLIIFGLLGMALVAFGMYGLKTYNQIKADEKARIQTIITLTENVAKEASRADNQETRANIAEATNANLEASLAASQKASEEINVEFTEFRLTAAKKEAVLNNPKFDKVFNERAAKFVELANKATEKQFKDLEEILDGN